MDIECNSFGYLIDTMCLNRKQASNPTIKDDEIQPEPVDDQKPKTICNPTPFHDNDMNTPKSVTWFEIKEQAHESNAREGIVKIDTHIDSKRL